MWPEQQAASDALHAKSEEVIVFAEVVISRAPLLGMQLFVLLAMLSAMMAFFSSAILVPSRPLCRPRSQAMSWVFCVTAFGATSLRWRLPSYRTLSARCILEQAFSNGRVLPLSWWGLSESW